MGKLPGSLGWRWVWNMARGSEAASSKGRSPQKNDASGGHRVRQPCLSHRGLGEFIVDS